MIEYDLKQVANQSFSTSLNGHSFVFQFVTFRELIYTNVYVDDVLVCSGEVATANTNLFTSVVNDAAGGTFIFKCLTDDYPTYENFDGTTCRFLYTPYGE